MGERWRPTGRDGAREYDRRFTEAAEAGKDVHGEADFVARFAPASVLDAGCGTGRVAAELARRGVEAAGVDVDADMVAVAREKAPGVEWHVGDLATFDLRDRDGRRRQFDVAVMAGNVMLFVAPGTEAAVVARVAGHVRPGGLVVAGFQLRAVHVERPDGPLVSGVLDLEAYDAMCAGAGLELVERWATWDRDPWRVGGDYAVSVHRRAGKLAS